MTARLFFAVILLPFFTSTASVAEASVRLESPVATLEGSISQIKLDSFADGWLDREERLTPSEVLEKEKDAAQRAYFGYTRFPIWLRIPLKNLDAPEAWILKLDPPLLDEVDLYLFDSSGKKLAQEFFRLGAPKSGGTLERRYPAFKLNIPKSIRPLSLLLRVKSPHKLDFDLRLELPSRSKHWLLRDPLIRGIYFGILLLVIIHNAIVFLATRDRPSLYFTFFSASLGAMLFTMNGYSDLFFGGTVKWGRYLGCMSASVAVFGNQFARSFLATAQRLPRMDRIHRVLMLIAGAILLGAITPFFPRFSDLLGPSVDLTIFVSAIFIFISAVLGARTGSRPALYFLISWFGLLLMALYFFAGEYHLIPSTAFSRCSIEVGSTLQMVFLSLALGDQIRRLQNEKTRAEIRERETAQLRSLLQITCHDLANPLNVVMSLSEFHSRNDQKWKPVVRAANQQRMILEYVRSMEANQQRLPSAQIEPVPISTAIENARFIFREALEKKRLVLEVELRKEERNLCVMAHPITLGNTVINNLVSNAIKFSHEGGKIRIVVERRGSFVDLLIEDQGIGIPRAHLEKIFSNDLSLSRPGTQGEKGTGFGMRLVAAEVHSFGAAMTVKSQSMEDGESTSGTWVRITFLSASAHPFSRKTRPIQASVPEEKL